MAVLRCSPRHLPRESPRNMITRSVCWILVLVLSASARAQSPAGQSGLVIHPVAQKASARPMSTRRSFPTPKRQGTVHVDLATFRLPELERGRSRKVDRLLQLALFPDVLVDVHLTIAEKTSIGSVVWSGNVEHDPTSLVTIAIQDDGISASISTGARKFVVRGNAAEAFESVEITDDYPEDAEPIDVPAWGREVQKVTTEQDASNVADILVVYTRAVRDRLGGTSATHAFVTEAIATTNAAYQSSGVVLRVRLAGALEVLYPESALAPANPIVALDHITQTADGMIDDVHQQRDIHGADAVAFLILGDNSSCGVAYRMTIPEPEFAPFAFSVSDVDCAVNNFSFAHELGHNFTLKHDRLNSAITSGAPYAYGYQDTEGQFRDIMAYAAGCSGAGRPCPRLAFFSNPQLMMSGRPAGVSAAFSNAADNRTALNESAATIVNFRPSVAPPTVAGLAGTLDVDGNGRGDALTDGLLALRYLFGFRGNTLTANAIGGGATRSSTAAIETHLATRLQSLDVTGNGTVDALTDGLLILRHMFGFRGDTLTANAIGSGAIRTDPLAVATYIESLK